MQVLGLGDAVVRLVGWEQHRRDATCGVDAGQQAGVDDLTEPYMDAQLRAPTNK
jgi:hypothetical protein